MATCALASSDQASKSGPPLREGHASREQLQYPSPRFSPHRFSCLRRCQVGWSNPPAKCLQTDRARGNSSIFQRASKHRFLPSRYDRLVLLLPTHLPELHFATQDSIRTAVIHHEKDEVRRLPPD